MVALLSVLGLHIADDVAICISMSTFGVQSLPCVVARQITSSLVHLIVLKYGGALDKVVGLSGIIHFRFSINFWFLQNVGPLLIHVKNM